MSAEFLLKNITNSLRQNQKEENDHYEVMPLHRHPDRMNLGDKSTYQKSAVSVNLFHIDDELHSVLIQRPVYDGKHSGQISFPGGKMNEDDRDLEFTARRESEEEIGVPMHQGTLLRTMGQVYIPVSNFVIHPYLFYHQGISTFKPDPREVEEIIPFNVKHLLNDSILGKTEIRFNNGLIQKDIPYFEIEHKVVWGATAMILAELKAILRGS